MAEHEKEKIEEVKKEETPEQPKEEPAEQPKEEPAEQPKEETPEQPKEKPAEQPREEQAEEEKGGKGQPGEEVGSPPRLSKKLGKIIEDIEDLTVLELSNLVKALEEKFGVTASLPMMTTAAPAADSAAAGQAEEKTTFDVILAKIGDKKIQVIKEIRTVTTLGLKEAKELVDSAPKPVKEGIPKEEAEQIKSKLEAVGATVELK